LQKAVQRDPAFAMAQVVLAEAYAHDGAVDRALAAADAAARLDDTAAELRAGIAYIYAVGGRRAQALEITSTLEAKYARNEDAVPGGIAAVYVGLRDVDKAFLWLARARDLHDPSIDYLLLDPRFDPIRGDQRFQNLLAGIGLR
jgi:tetratricopeptide (TPR) repeat protein